MDFWYNFHLQKQMLKNASASDISLLIDEEGKIEVDCEFLEAFREHLPLTPEDFWQTGVRNFVQFKEHQTSDIDDDMIQYVLIFISFYTDENFESISPNSRLLASEFYYYLLKLVGLKCFRSNIFENSIQYLNKQCSSNYRNVHCHDALKALRKFINDKKLPEKHLESTLYHLCEIIENRNSKIYSEFSKG